MPTMVTKEASKKWGYSQSVISRWCRDGLIPNAEQDGKGSPRHIPKEAECPKKLKLLNKRKRGI